MMPIRHVADWDPVHQEDLAGPSSAGLGPVVGPCGRPRHGQRELQPRETRCRTTRSSRKTDRSAAVGRDQLSDVLLFGSSGQKSLKP